MPSAGNVRRTRSADVRRLGLLGVVEVSPQQIGHKWRESLEGGDVNPYEIGLVIYNDHI